MSKVNTAEVVIPSSIQASWQKIVNLSAELIGVPSALSHESLKSTSRSSPPTTTSSIPLTNVTLESHAVNFIAKQSSKRSDHFAFLTALMRKNGAIAQMLLWA